MPVSIHLRYLQVLWGIPGLSGLKTICQFRWKPTDFHWKYNLLLWPWKTSNWSGWCMFGRSSIEVSTHDSWQKASKSKDDSLCHLQKFQIWKLSMIQVTLKTRSRPHLCHAINGLVIMQLRYKSLTQMATNLWTCVCPIGNNGKIQLWPIKSRTSPKVSTGLIWDP